MQTTHVSSNSFGWMMTILQQVYRVRINNLSLRTDIEPTRNIWILKYKIHLIENWSCRLTWVQESCHVKGLSSWSASHHVSLCSSRPNSSQEPEENKVAPLRPIALRRSSQWRNHQKLRENISTQGTVRSESQCTRKYSENVLKCSKSVPQKSVKSSLYTWALSLSWRLHL